MLQSFHEHIKGWLAGVIIIIISASFVLWGIESYVSGGNGEKGVAATVNKEKITTNMVIMVYQRLQQQVASGGTSITQQVEAQLKAVALQNLVMRAMLLQDAHRSGFRVSEKQAYGLIASLPQFSENGVFSQAQLNQFLLQSGMTLAQFTQQVRQEILIQQVSTGIQGSVFLLMHEYVRDYNLLFQARNFSYLIIPAKQYIKSVTVTDKMINDYYNTHKQEFKKPEEVKVAYILLSPVLLSKDIKVSQQEVEAYYKNNIGNYRIPQQWKIQRVFMPVAKDATEKQIQKAASTVQQWKSNLSKGTSFAVLMKQQQGFTETVSADKIDAQLYGILSKLKPDQVSDPFRTKTGYNLVRVVSEKPSETRPLSLVESSIRKMLLQQKTSAKLADMNDQLQNLTNANPDSLQPASDALKVKILTSSFFSRTGSKTGIAANQQVVSVAFSDDVLNQGMNSEPILLKDGGVIVLRVLQHKPSEEEKLSTVSGDIRKQLSLQLAQVKATLVAEQIQQKLSQGISPKQATKGTSFVWVDKNEITRNDKQVLANILTAAFQLQKKSASKWVAMSNGDTGVVLLNKIIPANFDQATLKNKQQLESQLNALYGQIDYRLYVASVHKRTKIKIYQGGGK